MQDEVTRALNKRILETVYVRSAAFVAFNDAKIANAKAVAAMALHLSQMGDEIDVKVAPR
jgi:hypothetical protein